MALFPRNPQQFQVVRLIVNDPSFNVLELTDEEGNTNIRKFQVDTLSGRYNNTKCLLSYVFVDQHDPYFSLKTNKIEVIYDLKMNPKNVIYHGGGKFRHITLSSPNEEKPVLSSVYEKEENDNGRWNDTDPSFIVKIGSREGVVYFVSEIRSGQWVFFFSDDGILQSQEGVKMWMLKKFLREVLKELDKERIIVQIGNRCTINAGLIDYYNIQKTDIGSRLLTL
jgi:hypothetical protein